MKLGRLYTLLIFWCLFLIAPGTLIRLGLFGTVGMNTQIPGGVALLWVLGYLVQFAIFLWIMNLVGGQRVLWWFVASLLPWIADWTMPLSWWYGLLCLSVAIGVSAWIAGSVQRRESLRQHGVRAVGVVLEVLKPWMNVVINNVYIKRKLRIRIEREDGVPPYEGILKGLFMIGNIPSPGDKFNLRVDPAKPQRFENEPT